MAGYFGEDEGLTRRRRVPAGSPDDPLLKPPSDRKVPFDYAPGGTPDPQPPRPEPLPPAPTWTGTTGLEGFDTTKLANTSHVTPKYVFGRIASQYNLKDEGQREQMLQALRADPSGYFRNASLDRDILSIGGDLDPIFGGYNRFDVLRAFQGADGPQAAQWLALGGQPAPQAATAPVQQAVQTLARSRGRMERGEGDDGGLRAPTFTTAAPTTTYADPVAAITAAYQQYLGRTPSAAEIASQTGNGTFGNGDPRTRASIQNIRNSQEAQAYASRQAQAQAQTQAQTQAQPSAQPGESSFDDPIGAQIEAFINERFGQLTQPVNDPARDQYADLLQEQIGFLSGDTFSPTETAALRAQSFDQLERDHQTARQRVMEEIARRGLNPGDGPAIAALQEVDRQFEQVKAQRENALLTYGIDKNDQRRTNRLATGESLANLETSGRNEYNANQQTALALLGALEDLASNRFNQSLALTGQGASTASNMSSTLANLIQQAQNQGYLDSQQAAALWAQIGGTAQNLIARWPTTGGAALPPSGFTNGGAFGIPSQFQYLPLSNG